MVLLVNSSPMFDCCESLITASHFYIALFIFTSNFFLNNLIPLSYNNILISGHWVPTVGTPTLSSPAVAMRVPSSGLTLSEVIGPAWRG